MQLSPFKGVSVLNAQLFHLHVCQLEFRLANIPISPYAMFMNDADHAEF